MISPGGGGGRSRRGRWVGCLFGVLLLISSANLFGQLFTGETLLRGDAQASHYFGDTVAVSGDTLAVGTASNKSVYIYRRVGGNWGLEQRLEATFPDTFSSDVTLAGDTLVVANEIYRRTAPGAWVREFTVPVNFHVRPALHGDTLVVAELPPGGGGIVHVFVRAAGAWSQQATLTASAPEHRGLGYSLALDGDTLVAGTDPFSAPDAPTYVFVRSGGTWTRQAILTPPSGGLAGWSHAIEGNVLALGDARSNRVHFFQRSGATWNFSTTLAAPSDVRQFFGAQVVLKDGLLGVLGEGLITHPAFRVSLIAHVFARTSAGWLPAHRIEREGSLVFSSLALQRRVCVVGRGSESGVASYGGAVEIFSTPEPPTPGAGWRSHDLGAVAFAGSASEAGGTWTVRGSGADIWNRADAGHYYTETMTGDGTLVVRVDALTNTNAWAKAGLMIREDLSASARNVLLHATPARHIAFQYRAELAGPSQFVLGAYSQPAAWLMLTRTGHVFAGYRSIDGNNWMKVGETTLALAPTVHVGLAVTSHDNTQLATGSFSEFDLIRSGGPPPPPPPPPAGDWQGTDIGAVGHAGSHTLADGTFTVRGSGADIWGTADGFHFVYRRWNGDGEIVARVASMTPTLDANSWIKAGVMFRETLAPGSPHAFALMTPRGLGGAFQFRAAAGGSSAMATQLWNHYPPRWVRLVRSGHEFTAALSVDGTTWLPMGSRTIPMAAEIFVGLAVTAHDNQSLQTSTFDQVQLSGGGGPAPVAWQSTRLGAAVAGASHVGADEIVISSTSADIWGTADAGQFVHRTWNGDGEIIARVDSLTPTHDWAKAGLMFRESDAPGARHAFVFITPRAGANFHYRAEAGGATFVQAQRWGPVAPYWLRLVRMGNTVTAYVSHDGAAWTLLGSRVIALPATLQVGFAVTSHTNTASTTAAFDGISVH